MTQTTADLTQALAPQPPLRFTPAAAQPGLPVITVNDRVRYESFIGVGAAMTDSSAWLIGTQLAPATRDALMSTLFSASGMHLSFLRVPMGASDYSATGVPYTYDDLPAGQSDPSLADFSVNHDAAYILPALRQAQTLNSSLYMEAVPWSPPAWMKANDALDNLAHAGTLLPSAYAPLADYFIKFLQAYAARGVNIAAIAAQNEPSAVTEYPGLELSDAQEADFVAHYLRPALAAARLEPDVFGWDSSWGPLTATDPSVAAAQTGVLTGVAWHCYYGSPSFMSGVQSAAPGAEQIVDECSTGTGDTWASPELAIASLRNDATAVATWNLALDPAGQPVQPPNAICAGCTGLVTVNESTGTYAISTDAYQLAQLSHFVTPGAVRIQTPNFVSYQLPASYQTVVTPGLDDVAFLNPDGSEVLYLYNSAPTPISFQVQWDGSFVTDTIPAGATTTLSWR